MTIQKGFNPTGCCLGIKLIRDWKTGILPIKRIFIGEYNCFHMFEAYLFQSTGILMNTAFSVEATIHNFLYSCLLLQKTQSQGL